MRYGPNLLSLSCTCDKGEGEEWAVKREMETINYLMQQSGMCIYCKKKELNVKGELDELSCFKWLHRCQ